MKKHYTLLGALLVGITLILSACGGIINGAGVDVPTITQAMGDQDLTLDNLSVSVAGQPGNWQGVGEAVMVYIITANYCVESGTVFVKVPTGTQAAPDPIAPFVLKVTCTQYVSNVAQKPTNWTITGFTDANGKITGARATKEG